MDFDTKTNGYIVTRQKNEEKDGISNEILRKKLEKK